VIEFPSPGAELTYQTPAPGALVVQSPEEYSATAEHLKTIKTFQRSVVDWFRPLKAKAKAAHDGLCIEERKMLQPSYEDENRIKAALVAYNNKQEQLRREETLRLQREQREREEAERLEQAAALECEAQATGEAGYQEAAQHLLDAPMAISSVEPETPATPKVEGLSYRETYRAQVLDLMMLVKAVAAGQQPIALLLANQSALDGMARSLKTSMAIPGVRLLCDKTPVTRIG
jgi:hypothetical protein